MPEQKKKPRNQMPDGRKRIRVDVGYDPTTGKRLRKTFVGKTLKECNAKRDAWLEEQKHPRLTSDMSLATWIDEWLNTYGQRAGYSTNRTNQINARKLSKTIGYMILKNIKELDVQNFANSLNEYSKSTVTKIRQTTHNIFERAVSNDLIYKNPCDGVIWPHSGGGTHRFLELWEINLITRYSDCHFAGTWAMLMLYAGLRRGEALALTWSDIDFAARLIHVHAGVHFEGNTAVMGAPKTSNAIRDVPLLPILQNHLQSQPRVCDFVCTGAHDQHVTQSIWASGWRAYCHTISALSNVQFDVRAHDLRHTYASLLFEAGVDIKTAQKLMGHATPEITMRIYTHLSNRQEKNSLDKLSQYIERTIPSDF